MSYIFEPFSRTTRKMTLSSAGRFVLCLTPFLLWLSAVPLAADDVHLINGSVFEDVVTRSTDTHLTIEMAIGKLTFPLTQISKVVTADTPIAEFRRRHQTLLEDPSSEARSWLALSRWGLANGLQSQARQAALFAARLDPNLQGLAPMLSGLGYEHLDNVGWIPRSEAMRLRGMVLYDGQWMSPNERSAHIQTDRPATDSRHSRNSQQHRQSRSQQQTGRETNSNDVALASIKLAEKALEHDQHSAPSRTDRRPGFGNYAYGVYPGIVFPARRFASPEQATAYNEQVRRDLANLARRPPGSIIPLNNRGPKASVFNTPP